MSLRVIHIFFIITADLLSAGFGVWCLMHAKPMIWAGAAFSVMVLLDLYLVWFLKNKDVNAK